MYDIERCWEADNVRRVEIAGQFKNAAYTYIFEAISLYLQLDEGEKDKGTVHFHCAFDSYCLLISVKARGKRRADQDGNLEVEIFGKANSISRLWENATKWVASPKCSDSTKVHFRMWWLRAAMARGHAEWLLYERSIQGEHRKIETSLVH